MTANLEIAVMYADLNIVRVPWSDKKTLQTDDVICIAVLNSARQYPTKRYQALIEHDIYLLIWTEDDCCLTGHDEDYGFFSFEKPDQVDWRFPFILPDNSIVFEGETIDSKEYAKAKKIFADSNGDMF